jgi:hypothetical protein
MYLKPQSMTLVHIVGFRFSVGFKCMYQCWPGIVFFFSCHLGIYMKISHFLIQVAYGDWMVFVL